LPSSQVSPGSRQPLPHVGGGSVQSFRQQSVSTAFPSSHCSTPSCVTPSPHRAIVQSFVQASVLTSLPSSHSSPASRWPSPQCPPPPTEVEVLVEVTVVVVLEVVVGDVEGLVEDDVLVLEDVVVDREVLVLVEAVEVDVLVDELDVVGTDDVVEVEDVVATVTELLDEEDEVVLVEDVVVDDVLDVDVVDVLDPPAARSVIAHVLSPAIGFPSGSDVSATTHEKSAGRSIAAPAQSNRTSSTAPLRTVCPICAPSTMRSRSSVPPVFPS